ncbi:MAG: DUF3810 domain-containing protein [Bacteroidia bacterium]|nr:DUF3810 domain-containing protein [Bacteroidia bacterium]
MSKNKVNRVFPPIDRRFVWIGLGVITLLLRPLFRVNPQFTEVVYSRGIYALLRIVWDYTLGWSPFALLYLAVPALLTWIVFSVVKNFRKLRGRSFAHQAAGVLLSLSAFAGGFLFFFYVLWGFNYYRAPVDKRLGLKAKKISEEMIRAEFAQATEDLLAARRDFLPPETPAPVELPLRDLEKKLRAELVSTLKEQGYAVPGRVRARALQPRGLLMQLGATGIYIPFVFEGHVDAAMPAITFPSTMTHEMAHGYGFGDEGTCNFWAWLACYQSEDPAIRYGGMLGYWREVGVMYRMLDNEDYLAQRAELPAGLIADLENINEVLKKYPGFFPRFSDEVYDSYLKNQGIEEGMGSYGQVVRWVAAWRVRTSI